MAGASAIRPGEEIHGMTAVEQYMPQLVVLGCKRSDYHRMQLDTESSGQTQWQHLWTFTPCTISAEP